MTIGVALLVLTTIILDGRDRISRNDTYLTVDDDLIRHTDAGEIAIRILDASLEIIIGHETAMRLIG